MPRRGRSLLDMQMAPKCQSCEHLVPGVRLYDGAILQTCKIRNEWTKGSQLACRFYDKRVVAQDPHPW